MNKKGTKCMGLCKKMGLAVMIVAAAVGVFCWRQFAKKNSVQERVAQSEAVQHILAELNDENARGLFFAAFPLASYDVNDFGTFRGIPTIMLEEELSEGEELVSFLQMALEEEQFLEAVYIGISPEESSFVEKAAEKLADILLDVKIWEEQLLEIIETNPHIRFHIIIEYPSIYERAEYSEEQKENLEQWYRKLAKLFTPKEECRNMVLFLPGAESWLVANRANYLENGQPNEDAAGFALGQMICKDSYALHTGNIEEKLAAIDAMEAKIDNFEAIGSGYTYVFFGDSVIGNYTNTLSIPEVVGGYTGAEVINCGYGGLAAAKRESDEIGFADVIDAFLAGNYEQFEDNRPVKSGIPKFYEKLSEINQEKLLFFISLGLNDYMSGCQLMGSTEQDVTTFVGAIEYAVARLREAYPKCEVVLMPPNFLGLYENGTEMQNGYVLEDLVNATLELSENLETRCIDVFHELGVNAENKDNYLADLCHPNELGRFEIGTLIYKHLQQWSKENA